MGDQFLIGVPLPATQRVDSVTYEFAFVNVSGGAPSGSLVSFDNLSPPPYVTVETAPINVLALYVPAGGGPPRPPFGPGASGATIDSFDETTGRLFNDVFVSVAPDRGGALTASGNDMGFVDTTRSQEAITAISPTSSGVVFGQWRLLSPPGPNAGDVLTVGKGASVVALAFYKAPPLQQQVCSEAVQFIEQIIREHGRPPLTMKQLGDLTRTLERCVAEGFLTQGLVDSLLKDYATSRESGPPLPRV